jgi:hypothetical protein
MASQESRPILVAVEVAPGLTCDAAAVRHVVRDELGRRVLSPAVTTWAENPDQLLVAVDRRRIVVSARASDRNWTSRAIATPASDDDRLRAVAWLAGNLMRDQVSADPAVEPDRGLPAVSTSAEEPPVKPLAPLPVEPPATPNPAIEVATTPPASVWSDWQLTATGGPSYGAADSYGPGLALGFWNAGVGWQFELQRTTDERRLFGLAIDIGPDNHLFGAAAFWGRRWRSGRWFLEATAGAGLELGKTRGEEMTVVDSSQTGTFSTLTVTMQTRPAVYGRTGLSLGLRCSDSVDVLARLGAHVTTLGLSHSFGAPTIGLRFRLP